MFLLDSRDIASSYHRISAPEAVLTSNPTWTVWFRLWREKLPVMLWVGANHFDRSQQQVRRLKTALVTVRPVLRRTSVIQYQYHQSGSILPIKHWSHLVSSPGFFQHFQVFFSNKWWYVVQKCFFPTFPVPVSGPSEERTRKFCKKLPCEVGLWKGMAITLCQDS